MTRLSDQVNRPKYLGKLMKYMFFVSLSNILYARPANESHGGTEAQCYFVEFSREIFCVTLSSPSSPLCISCEDYPLCLATPSKIQFFSLLNSFITQSFCQRITLLKAQGIPHLPNTLAHPNLPECLDIYPLHPLLLVQAVGVKVLALVDEL